MDKLGKELAQAYMAAYNEAMNRTFREDFAGQVAAIVTMCIANRPQPQQTAAGMASQIFRMIMNPSDPKPEKKPEQKKDPKKKESGKDEQGI